MNAYLPQKRERLPYLPCELILQCALLSSISCKYCTSMGNLEQVCFSCMVALCLRGWIFMRKRMLMARPHRWRQS